MTTEDKATHLRVTEISVRKLSRANRLYTMPVGQMHNNPRNWCASNPPMDYFWEPWAHLWTNLENMQHLVSVDDLWRVIVPEKFCTFGELRHILVHFYGIEVPVYSPQRRRFRGGELRNFFNTDTWQMFADDVNLHRVFEGNKNIGFWKGNLGPVFALRNRYFLPDTFSEDSPDEIDRGYGLETRDGEERRALNEAYDARIDENQVSQVALVRRRRNSRAVAAQPEPPSEWEEMRRREEKRQRTRMEDAELSQRMAYAELSRSSVENSRSLPLRKVPSCAVLCPHPMARTASANSCANNLPSHKSAVTVTTESGDVILRDFELNANEDVITLWDDVGKILGTVNFNLTFGDGSLFQIDDSVSALPRDCILAAIVLPEIEEDFYSVSSLQRERDPYVGITVRINVNGTYIRGEVEAIMIGSTSGEKIYHIRYEDGDVEDYTLRQLLVFAYPRVDAVATRRARANNLPSHKSAVTVTTESGDVILRDFELKANIDVSALWDDVGKILGTLDFNLTFGDGSLFHIDDNVSALPRDCILAAVVLPDIDEDFHSVSSLQRERDPYVGITVKLNVNSSYVRGQVQDIRLGAQSGEKLYRIKYEDDDRTVMVDYTLKQLLVFADPRVDAVATKRACAARVRIHDPL